MEEAAELANYLPLSFMSRRDGIPWDKTPKEQECIEFSWAPRSTRTPLTANTRSPFSPATCSQREYSDAVDQIREVLIHGNYLAQKDIEI